MTGVGGSTGACRYRGFDGPRPGSSGKSEQGGERRTGTLTREVHRPNAGAEDLSGRTSVKRGGHGDRRQLFPGQEIGRRDPPVPSLTDVFKRASPDHGQRIMMSRPAMTVASGAARGRCKGGIVSIFAAETPQGRLRSARGGFFPAVSPIT